MRVRVSILAVMFAGLAFGQSSAPASKTFYFAHAVNPSNIQDVVNVIRSATGMTQIAANNQSASITVTGTATQLGLGEWLFHQLDQPAGAHPNSPAQYVVPDGSSDPQVRVFYLANLSTPQGIQETVNVIRSTAEITKIIAYNGLHAIVVRSTPNGIGLAEWVVSRVDLPAGSAPPGPNPAAFTYQPDSAHDYAVAARVCYLRNTRQPQDIQEIINSLRSITEIPRITALYQTGAIILRGCNEQAAVAEWLVSHMDKPAGAQTGGPFEYQIAGSLYPPDPPERDPVVELYYLGHIASPQDIQTLVNSIRSTTRITRITAYNGPRIIVLRGTGGQIAQATALVHEKDQPAAAQ
jgi:hypothetical protein